MECMVKSMPALLVIFGKEKPSIYDDLMVEKKQEKIELPIWLLMLAHWKS